MKLDVYRLVVARRERHDAHHSHLPWHPRCCTRITTTTTARGEKNRNRRSVSVARAQGRATRPVRSTRTPCQQVEARTDSLGADTYARPSVRTRIRREPRTLTWNAVRESETESARTPRRWPTRASRVGEFLLRHRTAVTEPRLRPPSRPASHGRVFHSQYPSPSSCRTATQAAAAASATHTRSTNRRMYVSPCSLARPRSTERTTVPTTTEPSRTESGVEESNARASQPPARAQTCTTTAPPPPRDATRRDETSRRAPPLHPLALSTLARASRSLPHPRTLRSALPAHPRLVQAVLLATTCLLFLPLFLSPRSVSVPRTRRRVSPS